MAEINQLPIQESEPLTDSESRILSLIEASKNISHFSTTLINGAPPSSEVEFGYYAELSEAKDVNEFEQKIDAAIKALGFDEFSYFRTAGSNGDPQKLVTISQDMLRNYYDEEFYRYDLILNYISVNVSPIYQSTLHDYVDKAPFEIEMTRLMKAIYALNKSYGYYDYYNCLSRATNGEGNTMLSVTRRGSTPVQLRNLVSGSESTLQVLCEAIDFVASRKFSEVLLGASNENIANIVINPRPLKVLDALANHDFNITQVADYLCISTVTANKHLETARRAFGAKTNYYAIKQAVLNGLIDYKL
jgi:DNA-binding CsgD family transcriptional regulator